MTILIDFSYLEYLWKPAGSFFYPATPLGAVRNVLFITLVAWRVIQAI